MSEDSSGWWQTEENDDVATKPDLWRPLADAMDGFDLDPAAGCEPTPIADTRYTPDDGGLTSPWFGTVWLNPPFSDKTPWYRKLVDEYWNGDVSAAVALATVDPSADWFHEWFSTADVIVYLDGRDWYLAQGDSPTFSTQVGMWNPTQEAIDTALNLGTGVRPIQKDKNLSLSEF
jgi:hypothetical protein